MRQVIVIFSQLTSLICDNGCSHTGTRNKKHVLPPEGAGDDDTIDPITALEWDPLSVAYLLTCNKHTGVRLIDTEAVSVIATFQLPSAATCVHTLAWISTAPGMFLTGGGLLPLLCVHTCVFTK